jgi:DNA-directed RNA polymerase II subunit RPB1
MIRHLTQDEINDIVSSLNFFSENHEPLENILQKHRKFIRDSLSKVKLTDENIPKLKEKIVNSFYQSVIQPGEAVGVNAAQCIGEPITQSTLSTFHHTGQSEKNVTLGFGRSKELMNCTSNQSTPSVTIYFNEKYTLKNLHKIMDKLPQTLINDVVESFNVIEPENYKLEWWHKMYLKYHNMRKPGKLEWILRLHINSKNMFSKNLKLSEISEYLSKYYADIRIIVSPCSLWIIDILVNCENITIEGLKSPQLEILFRNFDNNNAYSFYMHKIVSTEIRKQHISGIKNIESVYVRKGEGFSSDCKAILTEKENTNWVIDTDGTNLREILLLPEVDPYRTLSNDIWEIYAIFDIDAVREYLLDQFIKIVSMGGNWINPRHIEVLVDKICHTGSIRAMARFGVEPEQYSVISKASFEEVMKHFVNAAVGNEIDHINTISPNIAVGKPIRAGTGFNDIKQMKIVCEEENMD